MPRLWTDILLSLQRKIKEEKKYHVDRYSFSSFVEEFTEDLPLVMERAQKAGVSYIFMPNIDSTTIDAMLSVCRDYPGFCYPMIGLHPTSVNESYEQELAIVHKYLSTSREFVAIGEIGLDLYWDKTFLKEQILVLKSK